MWEFISTTSAHISLKAAENYSKVVNLEIIVLLLAEKLNMNLGLQQKILVDDHSKCFTGEKNKHKLHFLILLSHASIHSASGLQTGFHIFSLGLLSPRRPQK